MLSSSSLTVRSGATIRRAVMGAVTAAACVSYSVVALAAAPKLPVETYKTENGMTVLLSEDHSLPVVAVELRYLVGSAHERKGRSGFAHLFEHLMFQGSKNYDDEYFKPYEPIGGSVNGTTNRDRTNYYERVPSQYLEMALWMESDRMQNLLPVLTQKKLDNQRDVVKNERRQRYENTPYGMVWEYFTDALYPAGHPYDHTTIGSHQDLTAASLGDVKSFFRKYYVPANAVLTLVGDFKTAAAKKLVKKYFSPLAGGKRAPDPKAPPVKLKKSTHLVKTDNVPLPKVYLAWHTPALFAAGDAEMDLVASVLSDGKTSRLYKPLVYKQQVAKDVSAYQVSQRLSSFFVVEATAAPKKSADDVAKALLKALKTALATEASADELKRAQDGWKKSYFTRVQGVLPRAQLLSTYYHVAGTADYISKDLARYTQVDAKQLKAASDKYIDFDKFVRIDIVPGAKPGAKPSTSKGGAK